MAGNIQVLRIKPRAKMTRALLAHSAGVSRPAISREDMPGRTIVTAKFEPELSARLIAQARKARGKKRPGRPPSQGISMVFGGPPRYGEKNEWDDEKVRKWASAVTKWASHKMKLPLVAASLHRDESSPHVHLEFIAVKQGKFVPWRNVRERITGEPHHRRAMTKMQDLFHAEVGERFGLARGERMSGHKRKHKEITQTRSVAALSRERDLVAESKARLEEEAEATEKKKRNAEAAIAALRSQAEALKTERSRLMSKVKMARLLLKEGLGHIHKRRISARELIELGKELLKGEGPRGDTVLAEPAVADLPLEELLELANRPMRKRTTSDKDLERIAEARELCKKKKIKLSPGRTRTTPPRRRG